MTSPSVLGTSNKHLGKACFFFFFLILSLSQRALASENCEDVRRNPERASRRQTRSMGLRENLSDLQEENVERSLEEELLEVSFALF